jgi:hypothetical protein
LITPATIPYYDRQFDKIFWNKNTLNPYKAYIPILELAEEYYLEAKENFKKELSFLYYPQLKLSQPLPQNLFKKKDWEIEDYLDEVQSALIDEEISEDREIEEIWERYKRLQSEFYKEVERKRKDRGLSP